MSATSVSSRVSAHQHARRAVIATVIGNGLEWFDFTVYSFFSVIISKVFFPTGDELTSYLLALATFGVGFVMRPVGGIVLGIYSDKRGRKAALSATILLMALGTLIIAITPGYAQIGLAAPALILFARLLQGFSAGGEMGSATAFLTEHAPPGQKGFYSSWIQSSIGLAVMIGAGLGALLSAWLSPEALQSWGWRVPFVIGCLIGPVGFYIRHRMDETPAYRGEPAPDSPLREVARDYPRQTLISFSLIVLWTVCTYAILFYIPSYATRVLKLPSDVGFSAGLLGGLVLVIATPVVGRLSDRYGRRPWLLGSALAIFLCAYPMFWLINVLPGLGSLLVFELVLGLCISGYIGSILAVFSELLPARVLSTGLSVAYNLAVTLFGGFATFTITWLIATTGSNLAPAFYIMIAAAISTAGALLYRDTAGPFHAVLKEAH
ncbi:MULTISPECIES: MFS transporter [unclassified Pseudomonas]|uniref:MFS transporter n=1 Tax=unclassified Pseudomonas TaxID=196821 RepID=UPI000BDA396C|nr:MULTISPECIES: MFS transporter [unclassified Pseudomonas]PVZ19680.1 MHS family proline/betaine transporter-like MFS transporter [Pseudomonas sp. URIL14HWK12:I12]PVZ22735.1 MHS family proline/betaine transporter-like MFS transporter [Pseudomonas sp. URIL14HWK12:I10]PVZ37635.1 MHS family proline/betaine transporter-like MFS transporter [Pseudomonas sp. URIL14HWK12:I11]SNZ15323.1 MFS transporter, MHS family, proline/betaine transporter [Pseudomonas sp. URIL14HWK12:I9]